MKKEKFNETTPEGKKLRRTASRSLDFNSLDPFEVTKLTTNGADFVQEDEGLRQGKDVLDELIDREESEQLTQKELLQQALRKAAKKVLTKRQYQIFSYKMSCYPNNDIAVILGIDEKTVENTYTTITKKLMKTLKA